MLCGGLTFSLPLGLFGQGGIGRAPFNQREGEAMLFNAARSNGFHDGMSCLLAHILGNAQTAGQQLFCGARDVEILWERYGSA